MANPNLKTLFSPALYAFWDFLNSKDEYKDLGLTEFKLIDGRRFQPLEIADVNLQDLPAHSCDGVEVTGQLIQQPAINQPILNAGFSLLVQALGDADERPMDYAEHIMATIYDLLNEPKAVFSALDSNAFSNYQLIMKNTNPIEDDNGKVVFFHMSYEINFTLPTNRG